MAPNYPFEQKQTPPIFRLFANAYIASLKNAHYIAYFCPAQKTQFAVKQSNNEVFDYR
jgi:hypothetical protein